MRMVPAMRPCSARDALAGGVPLGRGVAYDDEDNSPIDDRAAAIRLLLPVEGSARSSDASSAAGRSPTSAAAAATSSSRWHSEVPAAKIAAAEVSDTALAVARCLAVLDSANAFRHRTDASMAAPRRRSFTQAAQPSR